MSTITGIIQSMGSAQIVDEGLLATRGGWADQLDDMDLTPLTATADDEWTGELTGISEGSEITATASDDTEIAVDGGTLTATFADAGDVEVTVTEVLDGAANSPSVKVFTVVVS